MRSKLSAIFLLLGMWVLHETVFPRYTLNLIKIRKGPKLEILVATSGDLTSWPKWVEYYVLVMNLLLKTSQNFATNCGYLANFSVVLWAWLKSKMNLYLMRSTSQSSKFYTLKMKETANKKRFAPRVWAKRFLSKC